MRRPSPYREPDHPSAMEAMPMPFEPCVALSIPGSLPMRDSTEVQLLDAPAGSSEAYIQSQTHESWRLAPRPFRRWRLFRRIDGSADRKACWTPFGPGGLTRSSSGGRPPDPVARPTFAKARRYCSTARIVPFVSVTQAFNHDHLDGTTDVECPLVLRPVRAGGHRRAGFATR